MFIEMRLLRLLSPVRAACVETDTNATKTPKLTPMMPREIAPMFGLFAIRQLACVA